MKFLFRLLCVLGLLLVAIVGGAYWHLHSWLQQPIASIQEPTVYEVPRGANWSGVLNDLKQRQWIVNSQELKLWLRFGHVAAPLKAGEFLIQPGSSAATLIEQLGSDAVLLHSLTILEGSTFAELRRSLSHEPTIKRTLDHVTDQEIMSRLGSSDHPEGRFFPDTYRYARDTTDFELLKMAYQRMRIELEKAWSDRDPALPLQNADQALILASIVEKETGQANERPLIAGVFIERLERGMRLETDPAVIYGLGDRYDGNLRRVDMDTDSPYNTYRRKGLTPTPICLPGAAALQAAVRPQRSGALFFVATGKGDGSTHFSKTYEEHSAAVQRLIRIQRKK